MMTWECGGGGALARARSVSRFCMLARSYMVAIAAMSQSLREAIAQPDLSRQLRCEHYMLCRRVRLWDMSLIHDRNKHSNFQRFGFAGSQSRCLANVRPFGPVFSREVCEEAVGGSQIAESNTSARRPNEASTSRKLEVQPKFARSLVSSDRRDRCKAELTRRPLKLTRAGRLHVSMRKQGTRCVYAASFRSSPAIRVSCSVPLTQHGNGRTQSGALR